MVCPHAPTRRLPKTPRDSVLHSKRPSAAPYERSRHDGIDAFDAFEEGVMKSVRFTRLVLVLPLVLAGMSEAHAGNRSLVAGAGSSAWPL